MVYKHFATPSPACPARSGSFGLLGARPGSSSLSGLVQAHPAGLDLSGSFELVRDRLGSSGLVRARPGSSGLVRARLGQGWWALGQALPPKDCPILKFEERLLITITITSQQSYLERGATAYPRSTIL